MECKSWVNDGLSELILFPTHNLFNFTYFINQLSHPSFKKYEGRIFNVESYCSLNKQVNDAVVYLLPLIEVMFLQWNGIQMYDISQALINKSFVMYGVIY